MGLESYFLFCRELALCQQEEIELTPSGFELCEVAVPPDQGPAEVPKSSEYFSDQCANTEMILKVDS